MSFEKLIGRVYEALAKVKQGDFENVFIDNAQLTKDIYKRASLSGATFVVADNEAQRFVLLQQGVSDAAQYKVKLSLPIRKAAEPDSEIDDNETNRFCNRIFQIQRASQGLGQYQSRLTLQAEPEFLAGIANTFEWSPELSDDWSHSTADEMYRGMLAWRWLHWLASRLTSDTTLAAVDFDEAWKASGSNNGKLFTKEYFDTFTPAGRAALPEQFVVHLDAGDSWDECGQHCKRIWQQLRLKFDTEVEQHIDFKPQFEAMFKIYAKQIAGGALALDAEAAPLCSDVPTTVMRYIHQWIVAQGPATQTVESALVNLHSKTRFPIAPYFYFSLFDGCAKEHLIVPVLRSETYPLVYYVKGKQRKHTAVVIALASLNAKSETAESRRLRILEIKTILRICADRIIDAIFIKSLLNVERDRAKLHFEHVLATSAAPQFSQRVYVLGSFGARVSFLAQQSRALMLVRALSERNLLVEVIGTKKEVAVIGGGVGGTMLAAALAVVGANVALYEKEDAILSMQAGATHRFIHPSISTWPSRNSLADDANLPLLNWTAGEAPAVTAELQKRFSEIVDRTGNRLRVETQTTITRIDKRPPGLTLFGRSPNGTATAAKLRTGIYHPLVLVAIGFGIEQAPKKPHEWSAATSYWEPDALESRKLPKRHVFVCGDGDGALIDLARATLKNPAEGPFNHEEVVRFLVASEIFEELASRIAGVDQSGPQSPQEATLYDQYRDVFLGFSEAARNELLGLVKSLKRDDTDVTYGYPSADLFRRDTALINRTLAFLIVFAELVTPELVRVASIQHTKGRSGYTVKPINGPTKYYDLAIYRFGPPKNWLDTIVGLEKAADDLAGRHKELETSDKLDSFTYEWFCQKYVETFSAREGADP